MKIRKYKERKKGELYRPVVMVKKVRNGIPTSIKFNGHEYALVHDDYINGAKNKVKK